MSKWHLVQQQPLLREILKKTDNIVQKQMITQTYS